jgi:hypothetical protein
MSQITVLAECTVNAFSTITIELVEADETPAVIIVRWPNKSTITHPRRFPETRPSSPGHSPLPAPMGPGVPEGLRIQGTQRLGYCLKAERRSLAIAQKGRGRR